MPKSLYQNWEFAIEVNGFDVALFRKGQEPKIELEEVALAPAGSMFDQKEAGHVKFEDITLENGVLQGGSDEAARDWMKSQVDVNAVTGGWPDDYMREVDVVRYDRAGAGTHTGRGSRRSSTTSSCGRDIRGVWGESGGICVSGG